MNWRVFLNHLITECISSNGDPKLNDIHFINLALVSELQVKRECTSPPEPLQLLNIERVSCFCTWLRKIIERTIFQINTRVKNQVEEKKRILQAKSANASTEGQSVFVAIAKTIDEVCWNNSDIVVWNQQVNIDWIYLNAFNITAHLIYALFGNSAALEEVQSSLKLWICYPYYHHYHLNCISQEIFMFTKLFTIS